MTRVIVLAAFVFLFFMALTILVQSAGEVAFDLLGLLPGVK
jgi:hypothetical protein